jgi:hypothetical protein
LRIPAEIRAIWLRVAGLTSKIHFPRATFFQATASQSHQPQRLMRPQPTLKENAMTTVHNLTQIGRVMCLLLAALIVTSSLSMGAIGAHVAFENAVATITQ